MQTAKGLKAAGFSGYTPSEVDEMGRRDLKVLSDSLGDKEFFFGASPRFVLVAPPKKGFLAQGCQAADFKNLIK